METKSKWISGAMAAVAMMLGGCFCGGGPSQTEASLYVSDAANGASVKAPSFTEGDETLSAQCGEPDANDPSVCTSDLLLLDAGVHTITVSAEGYVSQTVTVDTSSMDSVHLAIELSKAK